MAEKSDSNPVKKSEIEAKPLNAIALHYDQGIMSAPKVLAKGKGTVAEKIISLAGEHGIPVRQDPVLVQALEQLDLGDEIPPELYQVVAEILVFIIQTDAKSKGR